MKENSVEKMIRDAAEAQIPGKFNLVQFKKEKAKLVAHRNACQQIIQYADDDANRGYPLYAILLSGVSSNAFKYSEFAKGYTKFDKDKADACFKMSRLYLEKTGHNGHQPLDVVYRICSRFYDKASTNIEDFEKALNNITDKDVLENAENRKYYKQICKSLNM